jgi:hypothetical protein
MSVCNRKGTSHKHGIVKTTNKTNLGEDRAHDGIGPFEIEVALRMQSYME